MRPPSRLALSAAPLAIGSAVVWGVVECAALWRARWVQRRARWQPAKTPPLR